MTRDTAREMAVQLIFGLDHCDADREAFLDTFFSEEHFSSLKTENEELYIEYPSGKMLAYIQRIVFGVFDNLEEIDGLNFDDHSNYETLMNEILETLS